MNSIVKSAIAGALALGATSAFALGVPSTNSSDLILYVDAESSTGASTGVYAYDTGITLKSLMPGGYVSGAANNTTAFSIASQVVGPSSTLSSFLSSHSGSTFEWTLEGGQYNGAGTTAQNSNTKTAGSALAIFTSKNLTGASGATTAVASTMQNFLNGYSDDVTNGGLQALLTSKETANGSESTAPPARTKYGFFGADDLGANNGTSLKLFGLTGNNSIGTVQSYVLGTVSLSANGTLTIAGNSTGGGGTAPVPLPPAVWLFGSGLLGLVGVSRRRKSATAV